MKKTRIVIYIFLALGFFSIINQMLLKSLVDDNNKQQALIDEHNLIKAKKDQQKDTSWGVKEEAPSKSFTTSRISVMRSDLPQHEEGWQKHVEKIVEESKIFQTPKGQEAIEKMKIRSAEFQERMQRVDAEIKLFEEQKLSRPLDEEVDKRLEMLYKLKALGNILKDKVVSEDALPQEMLEKLPPQAQQ